MFELAALDKIVKESLIDVPKDHRIAVVTVANQEGIKVVTAIKVNDEWQAQGYFQARPDEKPEYGVIVQWSR